jgi:thiamine phosphate synthase YjbQ (UPF0047 family)
VKAHPVYRTFRTAKRREFVRSGEDNGDAHLRNLLVHHQVIVQVTEVRLDLGPWQQVFYCA